MNRQPSKLQVAEEAWGHLPDWITKLVEACEQKGSSQNKVGRRIGYTGSVVSQVIRNTYRGNMDRVEQAVRDVLIPSTVACPSLGSIGSEICHTHRSNASRGARVGPLSVRMYRACRECPLHNLEEDAS